LLVRSHEVKDEGYEVEADGKVITIFSAPNYCDQMKNKGALIRFKGSDMKPKFIQYSAVVILLIIYRIIHMHQLCNMRTPGCFSK
jgi:hypothetical protein